MTKREFTRREAMNRARFEYGMHPYEPDVPCVIMTGSVEYRCECGFCTFRAGDIWDHAQNCTPQPQQLELAI